MDRVSTVEEIAARLEAAGAVHWRGRGELITLPWKPPMTGPILLIDLWSGFSGASIAMLSLGVKIYVLAAESNPDVAKMAEASLDQIVHVPAVELIDARMIEGIMKKRSIQAIVVGEAARARGTPPSTRAGRGSTTRGRSNRTS